MHCSIRPVQRETAAVATVIYDYSRLDCFIYAVYPATNGYPVKIHPPSRPCIGKTRARTTVVSKSRGKWLNKHNSCAFHVRFLKRENRSWKSKICFLSNWRFSKHLCLVFTFGMKPTIPQIRKIIFEFWNGSKYAGIRRYYPSVCDIPKRYSRARTYICVITLKIVNLRN